MYVTPKKRLMSITNALATQKYTAYSTSIDLEKAKVEEDGTILAGSPYPFSNKVEFPVNNLVLDTQYKNSEFIQVNYNSGAGFRNLFHTHYSVCHQNIDNILTQIAREDGKLYVRLSSKSGEYQTYQLMIMHDLIKPLRMDKNYVRTFKYKHSHNLQRVSTGFSIINGRSANGSSFSNIQHTNVIYNPQAGERIDRYTLTSFNTSNIAYCTMITLEGSVTGTNVHEFEFSEFSVYEGNTQQPYYPAVEDFPNGSGGPAIGLMFDDINVKEEMDRGIKAVTGKLISGGYVLEDRLPYPIDDASKENLKMIRFR